MNKMSYADIVRKAQYNTDMKKSEEDRKRELSEKQTRIADAQRALREYQLNYSPDETPLNNWRFAGDHSLVERTPLSSFYEDFHKFYRYYDESGNLPEHAFTAYFAFYEMGSEDFDTRYENYCREQDMRAEYDHWLDGACTSHARNKADIDTYLTDPVPMKPAGSMRMSDNHSRCYCSFCDKVQPYYGSQKLKNTQWYRRNCAVPTYNDYNPYSYSYGRGFDDGVGKDSFSTSSDSDSDSDSDFYRQNDRQGESKEARKETHDAMFYKVYDCHAYEPCAHVKVDGCCVVPSYKELISECLENEFANAEKFICSFQHGQLTHLTTGSDSVTEMKFYKAMTDRIKHLKCGICRGAARGDCLGHLPEMAEFTASLKSLKEYIRMIQERETVFFFNMHETQRDFWRVRTDMLNIILRLDNSLDSLETEMRGLIAMVNFHNKDIHSRYIRKGKTDEIPEELRGRYVKMCSLKLSIAVGYQQRYGHTKRQLIRLRELALEYEMSYNEFHTRLHSCHQLPIKTVVNNNRDRRFQRQARTLLSMTAICE